MDNNIDFPVSGRGSGKAILNHSSVIAILRTICFINSRCNSVYNQIANFNNKRRGER